MCVFLNVILSSCHHSLCMYVCYVYFNKDQSINQSMNVNVKHSGKENRAVSSQGAELGARSKHGDVKRRQFRPTDDADSSHMQLHIGSTECH